MNFYRPNSTTVGSLVANSSREWVCTSGKNFFPRMGMHVERDGNDTADDNRLELYLRLHHLKPRMIVVLPV